MAYCKSYTCRATITRESALMPFDDWLRTPEIPAFFRYAEHWSSNVLYMYFCPFYQLLRIVCTMGVYSATVDVKLTIDKDLQIIGVSEILCKRRWLRGNNEPEEREGDMSWYNTNENISLDFSIQSAVNRFFGTSYTLVLPLTACRISEENAEKLTLFAKLFNWSSGPWNKTIGIFQKDKVDACIIIQACFRGWCARKKYTFDPATTLGRFYAMKLFKEML